MWFWKLKLEKKSAWRSRIFSLCVEKWQPLHPNCLPFLLAAFSQAHLPFPPSPACLLHLRSLFVPPVIISCNRYNWGPSPIILHHHLFLSGRKQSASPLIPENLPESLGPLVPTAGICGCPAARLILLAVSVSSVWCQLAAWAESILHPQLCLFPVLPDLFWWWLEFH